MKIVKVISTKIDSRARRLIKYLRLGKSDVQDSFQASPYGVDSNPIKDMIAVYASTLQKGEPVVVGYINKNQIADVGEHRIFSTDADGNVVMSLHLKNDGTAEFGGNSDNLMRFTNTKLVTDEFKTDLTNLKSLINSWAPVPNDGGAALKAVLTAWANTAISQSIDSSKINEIKTL